MISKKELSLAIIIFYILASFSLAQEEKVGAFKITSTSLDILGDELATNFEKILDKSKKLTWQIYVPKSYDPSLPSGILLFQTYGERHREPRGWKSVMEEKNLIFVRIYTGGMLAYGKEMLHGIMALPLLQEKYKINTNRVYSIAYRSCNVVGGTAQFYPHIIKGSIYVNCIPFTWKKEEPEKIELMRKNRYVFIHGINSKAKAAAKQEEQRYNESGILNTKFSVISRLRNNDNVGRRGLLEAISFLDNTE
ncbi:MAG: hypothetical protein JKY84_07150 [Emcibacteraceae bacterium]|nr:hypothetical protein [Emcibacteraceae bacterium]